MLGAFAFNFTLISKSPVSHSKLAKNGKSLYIDSWNPDAKRFIAECVACGSKGYVPSIDEVGFRDDMVRNAIWNSLHVAFHPLQLNSFGLCAHCESVLNSTSVRLDNEN